MNTITILAAGERRRQDHVRPIELNHGIICMCEACMRLTVHMRFAAK